MSSIAIYAFTFKGRELGFFLKKKLKADLFLPDRLVEGVLNCQRFDSLTELIKEQFFKYNAHIFVGATGIAVRSIAPCIRSKSVDPAVIVIDEHGRFCISLLSGHMGGANQLAKDIASILNAQPVITTATDLNNLPSIDLLAKKKNLFILNPESIKVINSAFLEKRAVQIYDPEGIVDLEKDLAGVKTVVVNNDMLWDKGLPGIWIHWRSKVPLDEQLVLHPKRLVVGIGCNKGTGADEIWNFLNLCFKKTGFCLHSIKKLATVDVKNGEEGIINLAHRLGVQILFFSSNELKRVNVPNPSLLTQKHVGTKSVCEAAAILGANRGSLILPKQKTKKITIAVALDQSL